MFQNLDSSILDLSFALNFSDCDIKDLAIWVLKALLGCNFTLCSVIVVNLPDIVGLLMSVKSLFKAFDFSFMMQNILTYFNSEDRHRIKP